LSAIVYRFFRRNTRHGPPNFCGRYASDKPLLSLFLLRRRQWPLHYMYPSQRPTVYLSRFLRIPFPCRCPSCGLDKKAADFVVA
jgi:hypothetical protein